jgi:outer membrane protein assembly factor BamB
LTVATEAGAEEASNWPQFRGPHAVGRLESANPPTTWDVSGGENVRWRTTIPGLGHSSPVVWGDHIFVTTAVRIEGEDVLKVGLYGDIAPVEDDPAHQYKVLALDRSNGEILWERTAHEGVPRTKRHTKSTHANPTPATDGRHVVVFFGSEGLYCYDFDGELLWQKDFGVLESSFFYFPGAQWGFASSPVIHDGRVIVQVDVLKDSFLASFDVATGEEVWRVPRDDVPTWSTPTVVEAGGRKQVVVNGLRQIGGYDFDTGERLWKLVGGGDIPVPTPIAHDDSIFITNSHGEVSPIYAVKVTAAGDITPPRGETASAGLNWMVGRDGAYMPTPIVVGDLLYVLRDNGVVGCYEVATGEEVFRTRLGGQTAVSASLVAAGERLYATTEDGEVVVFRAGPEFEVLARNDLGEVAMATPAVSGELLIFRTRSHVVAIGE